MFPIKTVILVTLFYTYWWSECQGQLLCLWTHLQRPDSSWLPTTQYAPTSPSQSKSFLSATSALCSVVMLHQDANKTTPGFTFLTDHFSSHNDWMSNKFTSSDKNIWAHTQQFGSYWPKKLVTNFHGVCVSEGLTRRAAIWYPHSITRLLAVSWSYCCQ